MTTITNTGGTLESIMDEVFIPNARQRRVKASFWASWNAGPSKGKPTLAAAIEITKCPAIETWAKNPKFKEYFFNDQDHAQRLEYLFDLGLDTLEEVMTTAEKASDRLKAVETVAKLAQKLGRPEAEVKYLDKDVQSMDLNELENVIKKLLPGGKDGKEEVKD